MTQIPEQKRTEIQKEAQNILKKFSKALQSVKVEKKQHAVKESSGFREESDGKKGDLDFRERMFKNAPNHKGDSILAEKKQW